MTDDDIAPLVLPTPLEGAAAGEGDGGLSPASPATKRSQSKNRGGLP